MVTRIHSIASSLLLKVKALRSFPLLYSLSPFLRWVSPRSIHLNYSSSLYLPSCRFTSLRSIHFQAFIFSMSHTFSTNSHRSDAFTITHHPNVVFNPPPPLPFFPSFFLFPTYNSTPAPTLYPLSYIRS